MDLMQESPNNDNKIKKYKTSLLVIGVIGLLLAVLAIGLFIYSRQVSTSMLKVTVDGISNAEVANIQNGFLIENGKVYVSIRKIAPYLGYTVQNGEYKQYSEDTSSCYATNKKELVTFTSGSKEIRKYPLLSESESQAFELNEAIIDRANNLYISQEDMKRAFNTVVEYSESNNTIAITTLEYLTTIYKNAVSNAYLEKDTTNNRINMTDAIYFNNQKALIYNYIVVQDKNTGFLGVAIYNSGKTDTIITERYTSIEFIEGMDEFIVRTEDGKYGIIDNTGIAKVKPAYDAIQEVDKDLGLYLVTSNNKQGIINRSGKIIVYQDYDQVGLDANQEDTNIKNRYLLYQKCIPVQVDKKWGLIDVNGNILVEPRFDGIGCKLTQSQSNTVGSVLIPDLNGIVFEIDYKQQNVTAKKYGIISASGQLIMDAQADSAYAVTIENKTSYFIQINGEALNIVEYWRQQTNNAGVVTDEQVNQIQQEQVQQTENEQSQSDAQVETQQDQQQQQAQQQQLLEQQQQLQQQVTQQVQ